MMIPYTAGRRKSIPHPGALSFLREIFVLYFAMRDSRTPFFAKGVAFLAILYLLSPIDFIPDFIPVVGYLDDMIIVPLLLHFAFSLLPQPVRESGWIAAKKHMFWIRALMIIGLIIIIVIAVILFLLFKHLFHL